MGYLHIYVSVKKITQRQRLEQQTSKMSMLFVRLDWDWYFQILDPPYIRWTRFCQSWPFHITWGTHFWLALFRETVSAESCTHHFVQSKKKICVGYIQKQQTSEDCSFCNFVSRVSNRTQVYVESFGNLKSSLKIDVSFLGCIHLHESTQFSVSVGGKVRDILRLTPSARHQFKNVRSQMKKMNVKLTLNFTNAENAGLSKSQASPLIGCITAVADLHKVDL